MPFRYLKVVSADSARPKRAMSREKMEWDVYEMNRLLQEEQYQGAKGELFTLKACNSLWVMGGVATHEVTRLSIFLQSAGNKY
jgi:hypothetical protein